MTTNQMLETDATEAMQRAKDPMELLGLALGVDPAAVPEGSYTFTLDWESGKTYFAQEGDEDTIEAEIEAVRRTRGSLSPLYAVVQTQIDYARGLLARAAVLDSDRRATRKARRAELDAADADAEEEIAKIKADAEDNLNELGMGVYISGYADNDTGLFTVYDVDDRAVDLADPASIARAQRRAAAFAAEQKAERRKQYEALKAEFEP